MFIWDKHFNVMKEFDLASIIEYSCYFVVVVENTLDIAIPLKNIIVVIFFIMMKLRQIYWRWCEFVGYNLRTPSSIDDPTYKQTIDDKGLENLSCLGKVSLCYVPSY